MSERTSQDQDKIDAYSEYNYRCLVIWEHEIRNVGDDLIMRIKKFTESD